MSLGQSPTLPNQNGRDEEEASSQEEGKPLHEVQGGWVEGVEDAGGHQHGQAIHTGHSRKESTCEERNVTLWSLEDVGSNPGTTASQLCELGHVTDTLRVSLSSPVKPTSCVVIRFQGGHSWKAPGTQGL